MAIRSLAPVLLVVLAALASGPQAEAQIFKKLKETVTEAAGSEVLSQTDRVVREQVRCVFSDFECIRTAQEDGQNVVLTASDGTTVVDSTGRPVPAAAPAGSDTAAGSGAGVPGRAAAWTNYDFVPGETVLFYEDYTMDNVGDFPRRMELHMGNWEVVEWEGRRLLRNTGPRHSAIRISLPRALPERFTIELDVMGEADLQLFLATVPPPVGGRWNRVPGNVLRIGAMYGTGIDRSGQEGVHSVIRVDGMGDTVTPIRLMVDRRHAKVYAGERRVANVPNAEFARGAELYLENASDATEQKPLYLGPVRIAEGGRDLYQKLTADGRVATQGVLFAVNSAAIRPESAPTLKEIGGMLEQHPTLRLRIEGHTDATGDDATNQRLSDARAAATREYLIQTFGIEADRLESKGFGESKPVDSNDTPEGRQNNRRVELVRLDQ